MCIYVHARVLMYACMYMCVCMYKTALLFRCMCIKGSCRVGTVILPTFQTGALLAEAPCLLGGDL